MAKSGDNQLEQSSIIKDAIDNLRECNEAQIGREVLRLVEASKAAQKSRADQQQETLQALSRRLQAARTRVEASKAQREQQSHSETMRKLDRERQAAGEAIAGQEQRQHELKRQIEELEARVAELDATDIEREELSDVSVLRLQFMRGLLNPLTDRETGLISKARSVTAAEACVVSVDDSMPAQQMATRLWDLCSA